ncbi:MAG: hypothetical protein KatS3mg045_1487 [Bellilinea sp.]|nr:MAG: hypothetical protein KatS3mg045_1487 [Bellilinea sp.]
MSRLLMLSKLTFLGQTILLESIKDPWGESDSLLSDIERSGYYDENNSLSLWVYLATMVKNDEMMLDVGAYSGIYSLFAAKFIKGGAIGALEASAVTYGRLVRNIMLNSMDMIVAAGHFAATNSFGITSLSHLYGIYTTCAGDTIRPVRETDHLERVIGIPLDEFMSEPKNRPGVFSSKSVNIINSTRISAIKIDVEGAELEVLEGAKRILEVYRPTIICESFNEKELGNFLESFAYKINKIAEERNYLCIPNEKSRKFYNDYKSWLSHYEQPTLRLQRYLQLAI